MVLFGVENLLHAQKAPHKSSEGLDFWFVFQTTQNFWDVSYCQNPTHFVERSRKRRLTLQWPKPTGHPQKLEMLFRHSCTRVHRSQRQVKWIWIILSTPLISYQQIRAFTLTVSFARQRILDDFWQKLFSTVLCQNKYSHNILYKSTSSFPLSFIFKIENPVAH